MIRSWLLKVDLGRYNPQTSSNTTEFSKLWKFGSNDVRSYQCTPVLPMMTRATSARGAGALVVARPLASAIVNMQAKFASSMPMRTPVIGDRALGYIVNSSGPMGSVRIFNTRHTSS